VSDHSNQKPEITYPCLWGYKVVGADEAEVRQAIQECLHESLNPDSGDREFEIGFSRASSKGNYVSLTLNLEIQDQEERDTLFRALADRPEVRMVI
jgi:putative lipoic acid-binding regulatory protein